MHWKLKSTHQPKNLTELRSILLANRQVGSEVGFFAPTHPLDLTLKDVGISTEEMAKAVARLTIARDNKESVVIFGDYDVDGICSTAILWEGLRAFGILAKPFIPDRLKHGYGLSHKSLEAVLADGKPDLLISVDNGIVAHQAFAELKEQGIDAILTDHHLPEVDDQGQLIFPPALAIVHTTQLCGSTVAWFLARELSLKAAEKSLDLTAVATVADQMPLLEANRSFVKHGLVALQRSQRVGIQLLCAKANIDQKTLTVGTINYGIAPRINAMGRLKHGMDALRLLCTNNLVTADALVNELIDTNVTRQELTAEMIDHAILQAADWKDQHIIVVSSPDYHEGVVGLIAGRLVEAYSKPAIVIAEGEGIGKASARSIVGVNIIELIRQVKDDLLEAGGHPLAAGFGVSLDKIPRVKERLEKIAMAEIGEELLVPSVEIEVILGEELVSLETVESLVEFEPFGQLNREPVFGVENLQVVAVSKIGQEGKHLKFQLQVAQDPKRSFTALAWNKGKLVNEFLPGQLVKVAAVIEVNEWRNRKSLQLIIKDIQAI
ncbi:single-stranded-DNA-specific exonuclease RecJ [soil metagenome]